MSEYEGKRFYGAVTVSERGQIVIPAEARRDFGIEVGDKLLVLGDLERGLALMKASTLLSVIPEMRPLFEMSAEKGGKTDGQDQ
ncbi:MAG TPA: AbrB/MazE/SpoVT family DNA-binding domain-containing protein [Anaerolineae bacterium]|nr:AbrB/MazE/SpoVT family DNA-binding domain-containing protein [Anaerolineae bacterium]